MKRKTKKKRQKNKTNSTKKIRLLAVIGGIASLFTILGISMKDILYPKKPINAIQQNTIINGDSVSINNSPYINNTGDNPTFTINYNENE